jgi:uncharacterized protein YjbI with pentapeptide repeats
MINDEAKTVISTSEFYRLISTINTDERAILIEADLTQVKFKIPINLSNLNLSRAIIDLVELYQAEITNCDLSEVSLKEAELYKAIFAGVNLTDTDFTGANLTYAQFRQGKLINTNFTQANLEGVDFDGVGLWSSEKITIKGANFQKAILRKANLRGYGGSYSKNFLDLSTVNLKDADFSGALYDSHTRFPKGFDPKAAGAYLITAGISLAGADLSFTNLSKANLSGADLSGVNLRSNVKIS